MLPQKRLWIFGLLIYIDLFAGIGLLIYSAVTLRDAFAAQDWPTVTGTVTASNITESTDDEGDTTYAAKIRYAYTVGQQEYSATRVSMGDISTSDYDYIEAIYQRYPHGKVITVYYDPDRPDRALLEPGFSPGMWLPIGIGALFTLSGAGMAIWWFFFVRRHAEENVSFDSNVEVL